MPKCVQKGCKNTYTDIVGSSCWSLKGATCLPCFYAGQMKQNGQTPEQIQAVPAIFSPLCESLAKMGWGWEQLTHSYYNIQVEL